MGIYNYGIEYNGDMNGLCIYITNVLDYYVKPGFMPSSILKRAATVRWFPSDLKLYSDPFSAGIFHLAMFDPLGGPLK